MDFKEVQKHKTADDLWVVLGDTVYDLTAFKNEHPGGAGYIVDEAGTDATEAFEEAHPLDIIDRTITGDALTAATKGKIDKATLPAGGGGTKKKAHAPVPVLVGKPPLEAIINIFDFEKVAQCEMLGSGKKEGWDYYSSGGDDELTLRENHNAFHRIWLKPRVMVNVKDVDVSSTILGHPTALPVYLSAVAMCGLGHPDGELAWVRAAGAAGVCFMLPSLASTPFKDMTGARIEGQTLFFQLYVNPNRDVAKKMVQQAEAEGVSTMFITCDAPQLGNREKDKRNKATKSAAAQTAHQGADAKTRSQGVSKALTSFIDPALCWDDLAWFRSITSMKIVLKGIQTAEDAVLAAEHGVDGIVCSNHGGRQLDSARSGVEVLAEVMPALREAGLDGKLDVFVDGGVRRGTDVFKCLALGAKAVGLGRPPLYAMAGYGQEGIEHMLMLLRAELEMTMRLTGCKTLADIRRSMVITDNLKDHIAVVPVDNLYKSVYIPPGLPSTYGQAPVPPPPPSAVGAAPAAAAAAAAAGEPELLEVFIRLLVQMLVNVCKTVLAPTVAQTLTRSSVLLLLFLAVHMLGNLTVFIGPDAFNGYGDALAKNPALFAVECYLGLAFALHAVAGVYLTLRFNKAKSLATGKLFYSSLLVVAFLVLHLKSFRFGAVYYTKVAGEQVRDLFRLEKEVFADPLQVAFYALSMGALGYHLSLGWPKAVRKMGLPKNFVAPADALGRALIWPLMVGFASTPVYVLWLTKQAGAAGGHGEL
jgi:L-lactate dehydrogenase (cytochrome)